MKTAVSQCLWDLQRFILGMTMRHMFLVLVHFGIINIVVFQIINK